jgi:hypothetical protein
VEGEERVGKLGSNDAACGGSSGERVYPRGSELVGRYVRVRWLDIEIVPEHIRDCQTFSSGFARDRPGMIVHMNCIELWRLIRLYQDQDVYCKAGWHNCIPKIQALNYATFSEPLSVSASLLYITFALLRTRHSVC